MRPGSVLCPIADRETLVVRRSPPWAPGRREELIEVERSGGGLDQQWCMSEVDVFADLDDTEMRSLAAAAPMKSYAAGDLLFTPHHRIEALFILKAGRIRIFRVTSEGRALTTAILEPGTIFGEMIVVGQQMHDSFAEALDEVTVCVMSRADVDRLLLSDARITARIAESLGHRLADVESRLSDAYFKSVPERIAGTLVALSNGTPGAALGRSPRLRLTHEQLAALTGTSRETATKVLGELAARGHLDLGRGRITVLDAEALGELSGD